MLDLSHYVTNSTLQGRLLQSPPPRARRLALPAPVRAGFLADGLPVIVQDEPLPRTLEEFEAYLKAIGHRTRAEMDAELDDHWARSRDRLLRFTQSYRAKGA